VEDHHVDRPDVQGQQCLELTGTNQPIDLTTSLLQLLPSVRGRGREGVESKQCNAISTCLYGIPGGYSSGETPDPFPNSEVKPATPMVLGRMARESRSLPGLKSKGRRHAGPSDSARFALQSVFIGDGLVQSYITRLSLIETTVGR
jgi:hypothetical protein